MEDQRLSKLYKMLPEIEALVFDRTQADVVYAAALAARIKRDGFETLSPAERDEWNNMLKGRYTDKDLNRVEAAVQALSDLLKEYYYSAPVETKTNWVHPDIPGAAEMERYLNNIKTLIGAFFVLPNTPSLPESTERLTFGRANDIERILYDIANTIPKVAAASRYSGTFYSGQAGLR